MRFVAASLAIFAAGCSWIATRPSPQGPSCTSTSYAAPMADGLAGGVAGLPFLHAIGVGLYDAGRKSNGEDVPDRDYNGKLILASVATALVFAAAEETGRQRVYDCRRVKGIPLDRQELRIEKAAQERREAVATYELACETGAPIGSPADVVLADPELQTVLPCDDAVRGGSIVIRGDGDQQIGALPGCSRYRDGCLGEPAGDIRHAIEKQLAVAPGQAPPRCPTMKLERRLYLSVHDWAAAHAVARAALAVAREKRLSPQDGIVIAVRGPCLR